MNYFLMNDIDPIWLRDEFKKHVALSGKTPYAIGREMRVQLNTLKAFIERPDVVHYITAKRIHDWIIKQESSLLGQESLK